MEKVKTNEPKAATELKGRNLAEEYSKLTMTNNFMFCKVMSNPSICKEFLEVMLKMKIDRIEYINAEQEMNSTIGSKSVRLDVYVDDGSRVFDIEMQMADTKELQKRARFYQSMMDMEQLKSGMFYMQLKESYVIFLMPNDGFDGGLSRYTFENICRENPSIKLDDKTTKIFYNFNDYAKERDEGVRGVLEYFANGKQSEGVTGKMQEHLEEARNSALWLSDYIIYEHNRRLLQYEAEQHGRECGIKEGIEIGKECGIKEGAQQNALETARRMLSDGLPMDTILRYTGLSADQARELQTETAS